MHNICRVPLVAVEYRRVSVWWLGDSIRSDVSWADECRVREQGSATGVTAEGAEEFGVQCKEWVSVSQIGVDR